MANNPWDRQIINARERPLSSDINTAQSQLDRSLRDFSMQLFRSAAFSNAAGAATPRSLCVGEGLRVVPSSPAALSVLVKAGLGFEYLPGDTLSGVGGVSGLDDLSHYKPMPLQADATIAGIPAGDATNPRLDIVEARMNRVSGNSASRDTLDITTGLFTAGLVNKTLAFTLDGSTGVVTSPASSTAALSYKVGIPAGSPSEPAVTSGYMKLATLRVPALAATITRGHIIDKRAIAAPWGMMPFEVTGSVPSGGASPPTDTLATLPPGFEAVVQKVGAAASRFYVWILGPMPRIGEANHYAGSMQGYALHSYAAGEFFHMQTVATFGGFLTSGEAASLADATITGPALAFAEGTPYMCTEFYVVRQAGGTTDVTVGSPVVFSVHGLMKMY